MDLWFSLMSGSYWPASPPRKPQMTRPTTVREMSDWSAIVSFAQRAMGMTSVGLNAVLVVTPRIR